MDVSVHCPECGSGDPFRVRLADDPDDALYDEIEASPIQSEPWLCPKCGKVFTPHPCPHCGSYAVEGAGQVSGAPLVVRQVIVECMDCHESFAAHPNVNE